MAKRTPPRDTRRPLLEELEPRILLSADIDPLLLDPGQPEAGAVLQDALELEERGASGEEAAEPSGQHDADFVSLPLGFEENLGQSDAQVDFFARGSGYSVFLSDGDAVLSLGGEDGGYAVRLDLLDADSDASFSGGAPLSASSNYLLGDDSDDWRTGVSQHDSVTYEGVYDGIDVRYYGNQRQLEYDFIVHAGADPGSIRLDFDGAESVHVAANGDLVVVLSSEAGDELRFRAPVSYQAAETGGSDSVESRYVVHADGSVGFALGPYDTGRDLVIDPILDYGTYLGGTGLESARAVAIDDAGAVYVTGQTGSADFPTTPGAFGTDQVWSYDVFVSKLAADGSTLLWSTYVGGDGSDYGQAIAVDSAGAVYVGGYTASTDFATAGASDTSLEGTNDGFLFKLDPTGSSLAYSTYLGGAGTDQVNGLAVDGSGNVFVAGNTTSAGLATAGAYDTAINGSDAFVARFDSGGAPVWTTYLGGTDADYAMGLALDPAGNPVITGQTASTNLPTSTDAFDAGYNGGNDAYVATISADGASLVYGTYVGGTTQDDAQAVAVDASGRIFITGRTISAGTNLPTTFGAYDRTHNGGADIFLTVLDPTEVDADQLVYSTYLGGSSAEHGYGIALDPDGRAWISGYTYNAAFPTTPNAADTTLGGSRDGVVVAINPAGGGTSDLVYSTYLGGDGDEHGYGIAANAFGEVVAVGETASTDFTTTAGAHDTALGGSRDAYVAKFTAPDAISVSGSDTTVAGSLYTLNLSSLDPGSITSWTIDWGDGTTETIPGSPATATHVYTAGGFTYNILASATDGSSTFFESALLVPSYSTNDGLVRYAPTSGAVLQQFATGDGLSDPYEVIVGPDGNIYVTGLGSNNVLRYDARGNFIDEFVVANDGGLSDPIGLAFGRDGNLYVSSFNTNSILRYDGSTGDFIDTFASGGGLIAPAAMAFGADGNLYVAGFSSGNIVRYNGTTGAFIDLFVSGLSTPEDLAFGPDGHLYITSPSSNEVLRYDGSTVKVFTSGGSLDGATGLAFSPDGYLYVASYYGDNVLRFDATDGDYVDEFFTGDAGVLDGPTYLNFVPAHQVAVSVAPGTAIWAETGSGIPEAAAWTGTAFGPESSTATTGEWRIIQGAESPTRDEKIVIGVDDAGKIGGMIWNGSTWSALPMGSLASVDQNYWWSFDVRYEAASGDAIVVWANGTSADKGLSYAVWNGSTWTTPPTAVTTPLSGTVRQLQLEASPHSDEMVLVVSNSSSQDYAMVWNGSSWDPADTQILSSSGTNNDRTDIYVAYEQQSGDALVTYGTGGHSVQAYVWSGGSWTAGPSVASPGNTTTAYARWTTLASDPTSDRIAMGVVSSQNEVWLSVWDGSNWTDTTLASSSTPTATAPVVAVAFESQSGEALATYAESGVSNVRYRTWSTSTPWSAVQAGPDLGHTPNSMTLDSDPRSDQIMLSVQDSDSDLTYALWDGSNWGTSSQQEADTGETKNQPFLFLWDALGAPPQLDLDADDSSGRTDQDFGTTFIEDGGPVAVADTDAVLTDADSKNLVSLTVSIDNLLDGAAEILAADTTGTSILASYDSATGVLQLTGTDTVARYEQVLRTVTYENTSDGPDTTTRLILFVASDGTSETQVAATSVLMTATNDAPSLASSAFLGSIPEDTFTDSGTAIASIVSSPGFSDPDVGALKGIAIVGADTTNGDWQFTLDGTTWQSMGTPSLSSATLLAGDGAARVRFVPDADWNGTAPLQYKAWDQTTGVSGGTGDATTSGGTSAFSTTTSGTSKVVSAVNDAPDRTSGTVQDLTVAEDSGLTSLGLAGLGYGPGGGADEVGQTLTYEIFVVPDPLALGKIYLADGTTEVPAGFYTLTEMQGMQFAPAANAHGGPSFFSFRVQDSGGTTNGGVDSVAESIQITVTRANDAPVLTGSNDLAAIDEDPVANLGTLVSDLLAGHVTDGDAGASAGIAVVGVDDSNGTWEFTTDGGGTWTAFGTPSDSAARLLTADASTYVRFAPDADWNGTVTGGITFRAWDQTGGSAGGVVDLTATYTLLDRFDTASFGNDDGTASWAGGWIEADVSGAGPGAGDIQVVGGELSVSDVGNTIARQADLSGAVSATLSFDFRTTVGVEASDPDSVVLEISPDGGSTWIGLETFDSFDGVNSGSRSYDIETYSASDTQVRFRVENGYGGTDEYFIVNDVQVQYTMGVGGSTPFSTATASSSITVNPVNDDPTATADSYSTAEDTPLTVAAAGVLANDGDVDGDAISAVLDAGPTNGTLGLNADGSFTYTPDADFTGSDSFTYHAEDPSGAASGTVTVDIDVTPVNDDPTATADNYSTAEDTPLTIAAAGVLTNDGDVDGDTLSAILDAGPTNGTLGLNADGSFTYTPDADFHGSDSFTYHAEDPSGASSGTVTVDIDVTPVNDDPTATADSYSTAEDTPLTVAAAGVLANDGDVDGDTLSVILDSGPANGTLVLNANGSFTYTPDADFHGSDSFTYHAEDPSGAGSATVTVDIDVTPVNDDPTATADSYSTAEDTPLTVAAAGVLANDGDVDGDTLSVILDSGPANGTLVLNANGSFTYTPDADFHGSDSFTYHAEDPSGAGSATVTVDIDVTPVNDDPTATADSYSTAEDTPLTVAAAGVLANDGDVDGDAISAVLDAGPANGTLVLNAVGSFTYTPDADFTGSDSFTYHAEDPSGASSGTVTVDIDVTPVNDDPTATADSYSTAEDTPLTIAAAGVLTNDGDVDGDTLSAILDAGPTNGTLGLNADGSFTYTPDADFTGSDSFTYHAEDPSGATSGTVTVDIDVTPVNDDPTATADSYSTAEDTPLTIAAAGVLTNDGDVDGDTLSAILDAGPANGTLGLNADGSFTYTPDADFTGSDSFTYHAEDPSGAGSGTVTVDIDVTPVNDDPTATADSYSTAEDTPLTIAAAGVLTNDGDVDGDTLSAILDAGPTNGTLGLNADGSFTYTPDANFHGSDSFTYHAEDPSGAGSGTVTVDIDVTPVNDDPTATADSYSTAEDTPLTIAAAGVLANDGDVDGDAISAVLDAGPANGTLGLNADGSFTYTPDADFTGSDSFTYHAEDPSGAGSGTVTVDIDVTPVNDDPTATADSYSTAEDTPLTVAAAGVLANDGDVDGDAISAVLDAGPANGTLGLNANGSFTYTPDADFTGSDSFTYHAEDPSGAGSGTVTVDIDVTPVNDDPTATADSYSTAEDTPLTVAATGVLANDGDVDGDAISAVLDAGPTNGTLGLNADGSFTYTPDADFHGSDSFTYHAEDPSGATSGTVTVDIDVTPLNDDPTATADSYSTAEDTPLTIAAAGVLANDGDVDGDTLAAILDAGPANGTLGLNADGSFTYTPDADFTGSDSFTYHAEDPSGAGSATVTVDIDVTSVNDDPTATADSYSTAEDTPLTIAAAGVLANDGDVDGDAISAVLDAGPTNGTLGLNADGSFTYTPDADFTGTDSFTYHAEDPSGASSGTVTVSIDVGSTNDAPTAAADSYSTAEDTPLTIAAAGVLANDGDVDGDTLSAILDSGPANGTLVLNANGSFTYTPDADFHGSDSFTYHAEDPSGATSGTVTVDIDVTPVNDDPTAAADSYSTAEDTPLTVAAAGVLTNDGDVDGDTLSAIQDAGPANGTLVLNANGSFTYTPDADFTGTDSFTYHAEDPSGASSGTVTVSIDVGSTNDAPTAAADSYSTAEDTPLTIATAGVLANDGDVDGDTLSAILDSGPANGTLVLNANGSFTYTPDANFHGSDSFTYHAEDPSGAASGTVTVDIDVTPVNDDPTATADSYSTAEDTPLTVAAAGVLANDGDVDGDTLSAILDAGPSNGTLVLNADGSFTYTPDANFHGSDSFTYHAEDPSGAASGTVTVDIDVTPVNDAPTATADSYSTAEDTPLAVAAAGVLANDGDVDGDTLSAILDAGPSNGTLVLNASGSFTYTPDANFHGSDSFTYHAEDPSGASSGTVTVDIDVTPVNDAPTATADSYSTAEDTPLTVAAAGVLANDGDVDGDTLSAILDAGPSNGTLVLNADGSFTYTPDANFHGSDSFTYHAEDPSGAASGTVTVDIDVTPVNDDPTATADSYSTAEDTPLTVAAAGVLANDGDVDGDTLSAILDAGPSNGTLVLNADGSFTYTPDANFHGSDSFTYHAEDPSGAASGTVTVDIDVTPVNDDPTATADSYSTAEDTPLTVAAAGVLANDGDVDGDALSAVLNAGPNNGTLGLNADGSFTYTPDADFHGSDSFTYHAEDPSGASSGTVTVDIDVTPVNDDPTATADSYSTAEDTPLTVAAAGLLGNDGDVDGDTLSAVLDAGPANGTLALNANGSFTYTPDADFHGSDSFTYHAEDPSGANSGTVTVDIDVTPVNDDPTATADSYSTAEDTPLTIAAAGVLANDGDVDGDTLSAILDAGPSNGTLVLNANGSFTYTPDADFHGSDSFTYHAEDPSGAASGIVTVDIDVTPVNDAPTATADSYSTAEDTPLTIAAAGVLANDGDVDGDTLAAILDAGPSNGTLVLNANGSFTYTPDADFHGSDSFTYHAEDPSGASSGTVTVDIDVTPVNDDPTAAADSYSTAEDTPLTIAAAGVLANDGDVDGDTLSAILDAGPANGTLVLNANGSFTYTPDADFHGPDSFTYHAEDPSGASSGTVTVDIDVTPVNDDPTATADSYSTAEDTPLTVAAAGLLGNDGDVDGDTLSAVLDAGPANGTLALNANGSFTYTPDADFHGSDSFTYHAEDPSGAASGIVTVGIDVTPVNDAPTATADSYSTAEDTPLTVAAAGVLANDGDVDGDTLAAILNSGPANGTLVLNANGSFTYTPDADFQGTDSFTYHAEDPSGASSGIVTVDIDVTSVNDDPTATADSYSTAEDTPLTIAAAGVLANDGDVDGDTLSTGLVSGPANGALILNADGSFTYAPDADFSGTDSFTYQATDASAAASGPVTVSVEVTAVNDAPQLGSNSLSIGQGETVLLTPADMSATDVDSSADALLFSVSNVQAGRFELVGSPGAALGSFTQGQVSGGQVQFAHDGSSLAPNYDVVVGDGGLSDGGAATINFTPSPPADPAPVDEPPPGDPDPDPPTEPRYSDIDQAVEGPEPPGALPEPETVPESGEPDPTESSAPAGETAPGATPRGAPDAGGSLRLDPESRLRAGERRAADDLEGLPTVDITLMPEEVDRDKDTDDDQAIADSTRMARTGASSLFWDALDQMRREIAEDSERHAQTQDLLMSAAEGLALMTSTGLLAALLRSESLLALALSYIPAWRRVDPMAVLTLSPEERNKREREMRSAREAEDRKLHELGEMLDGNEAQEQADPEHAPGEDGESSQGEPESSSENRED